MMSIVEKRFVVTESQEYYGKYVVIDRKTQEVHKFHNLQSARSFAKRKNEEKENIPNFCEVCGCDPCDCHWGDY